MKLWQQIVLVLVLILAGWIYYNRDPLTKTIAALWRAEFFEMTRELRPHYVRKFINQLRFKVHGKSDEDWIIYEKWLNNCIVSKTNDEPFMTFEIHFLQVYIMACTKEIDARVQANPTQEPF